MSALIEQLKSDHKTIVAVLEEVKKLGITSPQGLQKLQNAKAGLLAHLKLEDTQLYPMLRKEAEKDSKLQSTLKILATDMEQISKAALDFFSKYEAGGDPIEFAKDFGRLFSTLGTRIKREESTLYTEYENRAGKRAA